MSELAFVAATLLVIVAGAWSLRLRLVAELDQASRLAIVFAIGCLTASILMFVQSLLGMQWSRAGLGSALFFLALAVPRRVWRESYLLRRWRWTDTMVLLLVTITLYAVFDARETTGDLVHFWGPKGQQFHFTGKIDTEFLGFQHYYLMHPDYPPLVPLVYAWASLGAHEFSWWGALLLTPLFLYATVEAFRGLALHALGEAAASRYAMLMAAVLTFGFAAGRVAGGADPPLLMFEAIALSALTFAGDRFDGIVVAALALAAASFTKVEGASFALAVIAAFAVIRRKPLATIALLVPPAAVLGSWIAFAAHHNLLDAYVGNRGALNIAAAPLALLEIIRSASYGTLFLPWIVAAVPLLLSKRWRQGALPLAVAALVIACTIFFYLHGGDPRWWIRSSADRVLLTPLLCLVVASAATARSPETRGRFA
ncbi:MAG: hypothetical protein ACXV7D_00330 [Thermoanaerobaculia bacterium]